MTYFLYYVIVVIQVITGMHLVVPLILYLVYGYRSVKLKPVMADDEADYAIIVTAYEQTVFLQEVIQSLLRLNYGNYLIYVVADKCDDIQLSFNDRRVILLRPDTVLESNIRSHFYAINRFVRPHQRLTIIDSDNLVHPEYLNELNRFFDAGYIAVQGIRRPKNLTSSYACLDAARDIYYHFYDGRLLFEGGSSATLAGSGMAFTTSLYKECLCRLYIEGAGFDKVLQYEIVKRAYRIAFAPKAIVYDEKTTQSQQLVKQRARWISTWFKYFGFGFKLIKEGSYRRNWNQFLFGFILLRPPLFLFLMMSVIGLTVNVFLQPVAALIWAFAFALFVTGFFLALLKSETDKLIFQSLFSIPKFMLCQLLALTKIRRANQYSVATKHFSH